MISVNGAIYDSGLFAARYPVRSIETECARLLSQSAETYEYESLPALDFELNLRREIVGCAMKLLRSGFNFEVFRNSYCNERYWLRGADGGFEVRRGVSPAAAVRDIYANGQKYATECATAMQVVYYGALLAVVGESAFDRQLGGISLMNWHRLSKALEETGLMRPARDFLPGDRRYFANPDVSLEAPEWQGENVIDMGDGTYYGHGVGRRRGEEIIADLNRNRRPGAVKSAYLMPSTGRPDFGKLYKMFL
jgi:protein-glutamine gamma-glutamyltransferase